MGVTPLMPPGAQVGAARPARKIRASVWTVASAEPCIEGRLRESTARPASRVVAVTATRLHEQVVITDTDGKFHLDDVAPGIYELTFITKRGHARSARTRPARPSTSPT